MSSDRASGHAGPEDPATPSGAGGGRPAGMSAERWREIQRAVDGALDLPPDARGAYLDAACGATGALR